MKKVHLLFLVLFVSLISISANKNDLIMGKWKLVKMKSHGRAEKIDPDSPAKWLHFKEDNILISGKGDKPNRKRENWVYEDDKKKLFVHSRKEKIVFDVLKLTKKKMILKIPEGKLSVKVHLVKIE